MAIKKRKFSRERIESAVLRRNLGGCQFSWSQGAEDLLISCFLPKYSGHYVDVGAGDPRLGSNSFLFYRQGWSGLLLEANPFLVTELRRRRKRDTVIQAACGNAQGTADFHLFDTWQLSTFDPTRLEFLRNEGVKPSSTIAVKTVTLRDLEIQAEPTSSSFLSVDVEGHDFEVLKGNDWDTYRPRVVCVEDLEGVDWHDSDIHTFMSQRDYRLQARAPFSSIYVHEAGLKAQAQGR